MPQQFLYEQLNVLSQFGAISHELPDCIRKNLKPNFEIRHYQTEAFSRMVYFLKNVFDGKQPRPYHLLFNMATGSGKTMIMAGAMLYLYEQGYRNFMFFVNSNNIIQKTKDNFLNANTSKYLFAEKIIIGGEHVQVREVENFEDADERSINIKFVSIQMLTSGLLLNVRENGLSFENFENMKLVLIGDEAHHNNADVWGDLVEKIHTMNYDNILLEFTATTDYAEKKVADKYRDKVLFRYDLAEFRKDGYSKEINLLRSLFDEKHRIIQALILNLYRQELATSHNINLKPVVLFKAKKTIQESQRNKENFHKLIENLTSEDIDEVRKGSEIKILQKAFAFFNRNEVSDNEIVHRLQSHFRPENCLSANDDKEAEKNQILLNTLEDENNPIRAIFAVQKLNEGWDVLNLFDIVRMYEGQNTGGTNKGGVGKTTIAEAQLIGRGARYYPFAIETGQNKFTRKFDSDTDNDLKILEELYYHTQEDSRYISELKKALVESGIYEDENDIVECHLKLKDSFKKTEFYKNAHVVYNLKVEKSHNKVKSLKDLNVRKTDIEFTLSSGMGAVQNVWNEKDISSLQLNERKNVKISEMPFHVVRFALTTNPFFYFCNLAKFCPNIKSADDFIKQEEYLGGFGITFKGDKTHCDNITNLDYLQALKVVLKSIETEIKQNDSDFEGSKYYNNRIEKIFKDKTLHINKKTERATGQEEFLVDKDWYAYNANFGTSEEKKFVEMFAARFDKIKEKFSEVYLIRNEQTLKIYDEIGRAFEPDFVLFCRRKDGKENVLQIFIEPKGSHLTGKDKWKEEFLKRIRDDKNVIEIGADHYNLTGVPFYNYNNENEFAKELESVMV